MQRRWPLTDQPAKGFVLNVALEQLIDAAALEPIGQDGERLSGGGLGLVNLGLALGAVQRETG